jgi:hypothetical protein
MKVLMHTLAARSFVRGLELRHYTCLRSVLFLRCVREYFLLCLTTFLAGMILHVLCLILALGFATFC